MSLHTLCDWCGSAPDDSFLVGGACAPVEWLTLQRTCGRAEELGEILLPAFDTPTGIPLQTLNLRTRAARNPSWTQRSSILSELGTQQVPPGPAPTRRLLCQPAF
jgi:hypothetical protein